MDELVGRAQAGEAAALSELLVGLQDRVYGLALRMLGDPTDAEDATQEILLKIANGLGSYRGESAFTTWVYRVASNYLLTTRQRRAERMELSFEALSGVLEQGLGFAAAQEEDDPVNALLEEEVKLGCTHSMLLCLDREHRPAFVLGEVLEVNSTEAAAILGIAAATFRKRLSRARARLRAFMTRRCGLVNQACACRCARQVPFALHIGLIDREHPRFAAHPVRERVRELERLEATTAVFRSHPEWAVPERFATRVRELIDSGKFVVLSG